MSVKIKIKCPLLKGITYKVKSENGGFLHTMIYKKSNKKESFSVYSNAAISQKTATHLVDYTINKKRD